MERFSRAILFVIALSVILGTLRFFEHDTTIYSLCLGYAKIQKCFMFYRGSFQIQNRVPNGHVDAWVLKGNCGKIKSFFLFSDRWLSGQLFEARQTILEGFFISQNCANNCFIKVFLPLADLFAQFLLPGAALILLHIGFF